MSEYIEGGNRFSRINHNAYWANVHLDTRFRIDKDNIDENYKHLQDCINHPTTGLLAEKKHRTVNYPACYLRNQRALFKIPEMQQAKDVFENKLNTLYPKTGNARRFLIESNSIVLNYVKPIKKTFRRMFFKLMNI